MSQNIFNLQTLRKHGQRFKRKLMLSSKKPEEVFGEIFHRNLWGDQESVSGPGSRLDRTDKIRQALPALLEKYGCLSMLDIPCGDFNWMAALELDLAYTGADIVPDLVKHNRERYSNPRRSFVVLDLLKDPLPRVDLILCRDCLVHFSNSAIWSALRNVKASGSKYFLTTTFPQRPNNPKIVTGEWRPVNLSIHPFNLPAPLELVEDSYDSPNYYDKHLGLWKISDLPEA